MIIGKFIKNLRLSLGMSQIDLAKWCGVSDVFVSYIERGRRLADIKYGEDFYWKLASLAEPNSEIEAKRVYAKLILADLSYRYPEAVELCITHIQESLCSNQKDQI